MRVLHLISGGDTGGAKTHVLTLLKELNKQIDAQLLCIMEGVFTKEAKEMGIPITIMLQKKRYNIFIVRKMIKFINDNNFDILHCHGARANFLAILLKPWIKIPIITTIHSDYKLDFTNDRYKQLFYTPINSLALRGISYYIAVTEAFKDMLVDRGFDEDVIYEVYNGISFNDESDLLTKREFFQKYNISLEEDVLYIGSVARLHPVKGIDVFLKGAVEVIKNYPMARFVVAGEGPDRKKYEYFIEKNNLTDKVFLLGHVEDIVSFYNAIDINVLASYSESFPYALLEGGRQKKPTVSSSVGGISKMIDHGENGFLFQPGDYKSMSKYLLTLIKDEELRLKIGKAFYEKIKNDFSSGKMAERHIEIYKEILEGRKLK
ncbi:glycosyltransferase family 4 protein [Clostridiisalibacter paucivorans]|uniref:glycosyltransferase family 4 protein n=1 Tax=Clostridiisalibacter paucivorans TaxID=408753 RepID=UPI00047BCB87|nr:glycosyltransferase family 4 protein [Clostridiisalibacter paucivorans]